MQTIKQKSFQSFKETNEKAVSTTTEYQKNIYKRLAKYRARKARAEEKVTEFQRKDFNIKEVESKLQEKVIFSKEELQNEEWRNISRQGLEKYQVSNLGRVKNPKGKILQGTLNKSVNGYFYVRLKLLKGKSVYLHRLVAEAFLENPFIDNHYGFKEEINHKDKNPLNNRVTNLEWCSSMYNAKHEYDCLDEDTKNKKYYDLNSQIQSVYILIRNNEVQDCFIDGNEIIFPTLTRESELLNCSRNFIKVKLENSKRISINQEMYC